jgi:tetratricopeptide (TPR) repeat protein
VPAQRVLLVAWGAADWSLIQPLLDAGAMPNLKAFLDAGARGRLKTLQPQFTPQLWAAMASGQRADVHGLVHALSNVAGQPPDPVSSRDRRCRCLWDMAAAHGLDSAVVNWPATYPLPPVKGSLLSDAFFLLGQLADGQLAPPAPGSASPGALGEQLAGLRLSPAELTAQEMEFFVTGLAAAEAGQDPLLTHLAIALARNINVHTAAMETLAGDQWQLGMVRYDLPALLGPPFLACLPPALPYVSDAQFERYRNTIPAALSYLDLLFGTLLERCGDDTAVLLVSERGVQSGDLRPADAQTAFNAEGGEPWYREHGVFAARGPGIKAGGAVQGATLLDITPTVLSLLGLPVARDMPGRCLREMFSTLEPATPVGSYDAGRLPPGADAPWRPGERQAALRNALDQGWLAAVPEHGEQQSLKISQERAFNLAMVALDARQPRRALPQLQQLHQACPDDARIALHLARCLRASGDEAAAEALLEQVVDHADPRPYERMALAQLQLNEGQQDAALMNLFRAEQATGQRPEVHVAIGQVYLSLKRWEDALRAFNKALQRDSRHAPALVGLASTQLGLEHWPEAVETALEAIDLDRSRPQAHFVLGAALLKQGRVPMGAEVLRTCLALDGSHKRALKVLAQACRALGETAEAEQYEARLAKISAAGQLSDQLKRHKQAPRA